MKRGLGVARREQGGIEWVEGDALQAADVMAAAQGCSVIVHAVNPPGYRRWAEWVLPMIDNTIAAAQAQGATVVLPGTVYNYGPDAFPLIAEDAPQNAHTPKGRIRVELEQRLASAAQAGRMKAIVVRAGDFFGPRAGNNWFSQGMVKPGRAVRSVNTPAAPGVGHQFAYLPDVARTMAELLGRRDTLPAFASFHMAGHWDATGTALAEAVQRAVVRRGGAVHPAVSLVAGATGLALRDHFPRTAGHALPVATAGASGQPPAGAAAGPRTAHPAGRSGGGHAGGPGLLVPDCHTGNLDRERGQKLIGPRQRNSCASPKSPTGCRWVTSCPSCTVWT